MTQSRPREGNVVDGRERDHERRVRPGAERRRRELATPAVSVIVCVRNEEERLPTLLAALEAQTLDRRLFEVIVIDDHSEDATVDIARRSPLTRVVALPEHRGLAGARNAGVRAARGDVLAFTDGDCVPQPDWLERGLLRIEESGADILTGGIEMPLGERPSTAAMVDATSFLDQEGYARAGFGAGANLWIRREVFDDVGLFNELVGMYGDETELCQRAGRAGAHLIYDPEVRLVHPPRTRARDVVRKAFGLGLCNAAHRRYGSGLLREMPPLYRQPRHYLPRRRIRGLHRLANQPVRLGPLRRARLYLGQHLLVQLPRLIGDVVGEFRHRRLHRDH